ncbi:MAG TPA: hypothetical protein PKZ12_00120 [Smithellaceae bacterium]|nr:hypothetical protein [Smithellaceae bacterium]
MGRHYKIETSIKTLDVVFADKSWDGVNIPQGQQCSRFGGTTPDHSGIDN